MDRIAFKETKLCLNDYVVLCYIFLTFKSFLIIKVVLVFITIIFQAIFMPVTIVAGGVTLVFSFRDQPIVFKNSISVFTRRQNFYIPI